MHNEQDEIPLKEVAANKDASDNVETRPKKLNYFLYIIAAIVNLLSIASGSAIVWVTPALPKLDGSRGIEENPFSRPITTSEISLLAALTPLGGVVGPLGAAKIAAKFGRKRMLLILACLLGVSYLIPVVAKTIAWFYTSRFLIGVAVGGVYAVIPVYLTEIAENHNRGALGCSMAIFVACGMTVTLIIGPYLSIPIFSLVCATPIFIFVPIFVILGPETPPFLASTNDVKNLAKSLFKLRNNSPEEIHKEMDRILEAAKRTSSQNSGRLQDLFKVAYLRRTLLISTTLCLFQQGVGFGCVVSYMQIIFEASKANLASEFCVMIVGTCQLLGTLLSSIIVDRAGRRMLLLGSTFGIFVALSTLGLYFWLKNNQFQLDGFSWLPILCLSVFIVSFGIGLGPVAWVVMAEVFPPNVKSYAASIVGCSTFVLSFIVVVAFPHLSLVLGMAKCFVMFSVVSLAGCVFIYWMVPETKGKTLEEIQRSLRRR